MPPTPSVLFVNQHYWPDVAATGQQLTDLAEYLAADGLEVHVLAGAGGYGKGPRGRSGAEVRHGVTIHRVRTTRFGRTTNVGRVTDYASFYAGAFAHALRSRYDLTVYLTTPPLLPYVGAVVSRLRRRPYGVWSMDLHPDAEVALGMIREGSPLTRSLHAVNNAGYRRAQFVVALGPHMARRIAAKGVEPSRIEEISVWGGRDEVQPIEAADNPLRSELGLEDKFVVMYSGNAGLAHRFDEVQDAMVALRDHERIEFVFAGGGPRRPSLESFAEAQGLSNVRFLDYFPREQLAEALSLADVHLLTLRADMAGIAVPSKLFGAMAAARPTAVVAPTASEPAEIVGTNEIGIVLAPGEQGLAKQLESLAARPADAVRMGARARRVFLESYEREVCCRAWADVIRSAIES
ncbi:glycosyltransferase family 4 protein [Rubrivirga sp.]|uniref:glycosyltransferase family 4 protein n=1 Tax=Rubrivirga sp. TaxID=1885344 RepID=UPI003C70DF81